MSVKEGADQKPASTDGKSAGGICSKCHCGLSWMGWASLIIVMVQNAIGGMLVRYTKAFVEAEYSSEVGVLIQEKRSPISPTCHTPDFVFIARAFPIFVNPHSCPCVTCPILPAQIQELVFKLPISLVFYICECGGPRRMLRALRADSRNFPTEWLKMAFPATALCTVLIMKRSLSCNQWLAIFTLFVGVVCVQDFSATKTSGKPGQNQILGVCSFLLAGNLALPCVPHMSHSIFLRRITRFFLLNSTTTALLLALASVYFEKMLKTDRKPSLWLRNIQLAFIGAIIAACVVAFKLRMQTEPHLASGDLMYGIDALVWFSLFWQGGGGLIVALTIKYADNIIRGFAQTGSILIIAVLSHVFLDEDVTAQFCVGGILVTGAILLYSVKTKDPRDLCCCSLRCGSWTRIESPGAPPPQPADDGFGLRPVPSSVYGQVERVQ